MPGSLTIIIERKSHQFWHGVLMQPIKVRLQKPICMWYFEQLQNVTAIDYW